MNKKVVKVSAPGKLMLFGEHSVVYGMPCIVTAVNQRMHVKIQKMKGDLIIINAPEVKINNFSISISDLGKIEYPKEVKFVLKSIEVYFNKYKVSSGLKITTHSEFSNLFGFGSSSAVTVCMINALSEIFNIEVSNKSLFDIAYKTVLSVQGVGSGFDLAVAVSGGTIYFIKGGKIIRPINVGRLPLIVGYTGIKADTATLVRRVSEDYKKNKKKIEEIFNSVTKIVNKSRSLLVLKDYVKLGELMNENQKLLYRLGVSIPKLDKLTKAATDAKAYGAKLSGAGGGDCMIALADKKDVRKVKKAISEAGGIVIPVKTGAEGVKIEK